MTFESRPVSQLDPLTDVRWAEFIEHHPSASVFHTPAWLKAIRLTYGYEPIAFTTSTGGALSNGVVFAQVNSWLTGRRLVSLPFSDHCQPLASGEELQTILDHLQRQRKKDRLRYIEIRPLSWGQEETAAGCAFSESRVTTLQTIDLSPDVAAIYKGFHDSCIRRKIKRAERESLVYESGRSEDLLQKFRQLLLLTRRRHKLPPQPAAWFRNLVMCLGDNMQIHVLSKDSEPVASIITLSHKKQVTYKYGVSDARFHNLGGTPLLFWKIIQQAKDSGAEVFDLGRSDSTDPGLIAFKQHLGAVSSEIRYYRNPAAGTKPVKKRIDHSWAQDAFARLPDPVLIAAGEVLYRHLG